MSNLTNKQALQLHLRTHLSTSEISYQQLANIAGESRQSVHQTLNSESVSLDKIISLAEKWGFTVVVKLEDPINKRGD